MTGTPASADVGPANGKWLMVAVSMALFCVQIDYFAMNLALPRMARIPAWIRGWSV